jgi:hypothetical protein
MKARIRENAYGNWYGYVGNKKVQMFYGNHVAQQFDAEKWLERVTATPERHAELFAKFIESKQLEHARITVAHDTVNVVMSGKDDGLFIIEEAKRERGVIAHTGRRSFSIMFFQTTQR